MAQTQRKMQLLQVTPDVFLAEPIQPADEEAPPHPTSEPELVILFGWMGAGHTHLQKYTDAYRLEFPAASILLIRSNANSFLQTTRQQLNALRPAHALLSARYHAVTPGPSSPILVHTFSNGGSINLQHLDMLFGEAAKKAAAASVKGETAPLLAGAVGNAGPSSLPARAFVFDSCPGGADVGKTVAAFTAPLKSQWVKVPASLLVGAAYFLAKVFYSVTRTLSPIDAMRNYLSASLAPVPRLYIYGPGDVLISASDVEAHAEEAKKQGIDVRLERFNGSMHVAHMRADPDRYWGAVKDIWLGRTA